MLFQDFDWTDWRPEAEATLLFVLRGNEILLIHKKRGIGAGKINGPGGKVDKGESPLDAAIREVEEELVVTPTGVEEAGVIWFQVIGSLSIRIHVFKASACRGEPQETAEATPLWTPLAQIPYDRMWEDDRYWLPLLLTGQSFEIRTLFDGDTLIGHEIL